jgi:hypothetical protein
MPADGYASDPWQGPVANFVLPVLATWRLSHMLWAEDGPWNLIAKLRRWAAGHGTRVFDCFYCISLWVALPLALLVARSFTAWLLDWLAFSAAAILLERLTTGANAPPPAVWRQEPPSDSPDE